MKYIYVVGNNRFGEVIISVDNTGKNEYDFILYILFLIGYIDIWMLTNIKEYTETDKNVISYKLICRDIFNSDIDYFISATLKKINGILKRTDLSTLNNISNSIDIKDLVKNMISWVYKNILTIKKQMIINVLQLIKEYDDESSSIEENLSNYFHLKLSSYEFDRIDINKSEIDFLPKEFINDNIYGQQSLNDRKIENISNKIIEKDSISNSINNEISFSEEVTDYKISEREKRESINNKIIGETNVSNLIIEEDRIIEPRLIENDFKKESLSKYNNIIQKFISLNNIDETLDDLIESLEKYPDQDTIKFSCERMIEENYNFGLDLLLCIFELNNSKSKLIRFTSFLNNIEKREAIYLYKLQKNSMSNKVKKLSKSIIISRFPSRNFVEKIVYLVM